MDEELVRDSSSDDGDTSKTVSPFPYTEFFEEQCPYYLAMGMTWEQYWDGDNDMPRIFREKAKIERSRKNYEAWLQGGYIYQALLAVAPMFNALAKDHTPADYTDELIPLSKEEAEEQRIARERKVMEERLRRFKERAMRINEHKEEKGGVE